MHNDNTPMNERAHDHDELLELLHKVWAEDYFIWNPVYVRRVRQRSLVSLGSLTRPVNDRERSTFK